jgi:hypothetical protein
MSTATRLGARHSTNNTDKDHLIWECELLGKQRQVLRNRITKAGGNWPITNTDLANKNTTFFQNFVKNINFKAL